MTNLVVLCHKAGSDGVKAQPWCELMGLVYWCCGGWDEAMAWKDAGRPDGRHSATHTSNIQH